MAFHPFLYRRVRLGVAAGLVASNGFFGGLSLARTVDDDVIDVGLKDIAATQKVELPPELSAPAAGTMGALGDGHIIQAIIAFFQSPAGQALLQALIAAIIAMLTGA